MKTSTRNILIILVAILVVAMAWTALTSTPSDDTIQKTDDAYLRTHFTDVSPRIAGQVSDVVVADYQQVRKGDLLFAFDNRQQQASLLAAQASLAKAQATVERLSAELRNQSNQIDIARNAVTTAQARYTLASADAERYQNMENDGSGTRRASENANSVLVEARGAVKNATLTLNAEEEKSSIIKASIAEAKALVELSRANLEQAQLTLSYTRVTAPVDGVVAQRKVREGGYIQAGQAALTLVPQNDFYVEAHFLETQIANMHRGDKVSIHFDGLPDSNYTGTVASFGPASGLSYSPVDPINATGNFTKIVQRLPVRLQFDVPANDLERLRAGMSAVVEVTTGQVKD